MTGVQTCALPILKRKSMSMDPPVSRSIFNIVPITHKSLRKVEPQEPFKARPMPVFVPKIPLGSDKLLTKTVPFNLMTEK